MGDVVDERPALERLLDVADCSTSLLAHLPAFEQVRCASVSKSWRTASAVALDSFHVLDLRPLDAVLTDEALAAILLKCSGLRSLNLSCCRKLTDNALAPLASCCPLLVELNLACLPKLTAEGVGRVTDALGQQLTSLELGGCTGISDADLVGRFGHWLELDDDEDGLGKVQG